MTFLLLTISPFWNWNVYPNSTSAIIVFWKPITCFLVGQVHKWRAILPQDGSISVIFQEQADIATPPEEPPENAGAEKPVCPGGQLGLSGPTSGSAPLCPGWLQTQTWPLLVPPTSSGGNTWVSWMCFAQFWGQSWQGALLCSSGIREAAYQPPSARPWVALEQELPPHQEVCCPVWRLCHLLLTAGTSPRGRKQMLHVSEGPGRWTWGLGWRSTQASLGRFKANSISGTAKAYPDLHRVQWGTNEA